MFTLTPNGDPIQPILSPLRTNDFVGTQYVSWKTADKAAFVPTLGEVRQEVEKAVRMKQARELAIEAAKGIVVAEPTGSDLSRDARYPSADELEPSVGGSSGSAKKSAAGRISTGSI